MKKNAASFNERKLAIIGIVGVTASALIVGLFNPTTAGFFPVCPLHAATGLNCPGCGLTRGFHALFNGDFTQALQYNAALPIFALVFLYLFASMVAVAVRGRGLKLNILKPGLLWAFLIVTVVFGIVRNISVYPFTLLSP